MDRGARPDVGAARRPLSRNRRRSRLSRKRRHFSAELRETALAHAIQNKSEAAYRRGDALEKRRSMMEAWAQWCQPREPNVTPFARPATA
jgi:hypothetical protein